MKINTYNILTYGYFKYCVDYDYENTDCIGECDTYCRCSRVVNIKINSINYCEIYKNITGYYEVKNIKDYCLERVLFRLITLDNVEGYGVDGYYGEEFEVNLNNDTLFKVNDYLVFLENNTDTAIIEDALIKEYGYVLNELKDKNWYMESVLIKDIDSFNENYYRKLDLKTVETYKKNSDMTCLCIKIPVGKYRLIDGYHRFAAANQTNKSVIKVVYCAD